MERQLIAKPGTSEAQTNGYMPSSLSYRPHFTTRSISHSRKFLSNRPRLCPVKLQAKLRIGQPNDIYEQEADRVAEQIMRMPVPVIQRKCVKCDEDEKKVLLAKELPGQMPITQDQDVPPIVQDVLSSPGQPLDQATRSFMEPRFGHDFSRVRVHNDVKAAESTRAVNAMAYTVGQNVVFGTGQYMPRTSMGKLLLAHELAHVVQQSSASVVHDSDLRLGPENGLFEKEANQVGHEFNSTAAPRLVWHASHSIQRQLPLEEQRQYSEDCSKYMILGGADACEYYNCREANMGNVCGPRGYYLGYGLKYCDRFSRVLYPTLSDVGKAWLDKTRLCLMQHIQGKIPWDTTCEDVKKSAFNSHPACYVRAGICFLPPSDWSKILGIIDSEDNDLVQAIKTGVSCIGNWGPLMFPITSLSAGGGYSGLMERDRKQVYGR